MLDERRPHFLEGFDPSTSSEKLKIPHMFVKHLGGLVSGTAWLTGPSGNTWTTNLVQLIDGLFFQDGWPAFVRDHCLEQGDSLVFRCDDNLQFTVQIFDRSSCEKEAAFSAKCSQDPTRFGSHDMKKRHREDSFLLDSIIEGVPKKMRSAQGLSDKDRCIAEDGVCSSDENTIPSPLYGTENNCSTLNNAVTIAVPSQAEICDEHLEVAISNRRNKDYLLLSSSEAERTAQSFTSCFPYFTKVMKRFNISGSYTLNVPYQFATEHLPKCKVKIVLRNLEGQSWTVNSIPTTRVQTSHTFCGGWLGFVRENNIDVGDICIFELVRKCELRVHILRVEKEGIDDLIGKIVQRGSSAASSHKISQRKSKKVRSVSHDMYLQQTKVELSDKNGPDHDKLKCNTMLKSPAAYSQSKSCSRRSAIWKNTNLERKQGSFIKGYMSMKSAPEEKVAAQSFISSFPHFVRIMKKFNVSGSYTLKIPFQFSMAHLPTCRTEIILRNLKGESWTVNSIPTTKVQTLHTFCGGWMAFVRDNDIHLGDICIFELVGECEMRVHISTFGMKALGYSSTDTASNAIPVGFFPGNQNLG